MCCFKTSHLGRYCVRNTLGIERMDPDSLNVLGGLALRLWLCFLLDGSMGIQRPEHAENLLTGTTESSEQMLGLRL